MATVLWPITVCLDRYGGHFSGGQWIAFHALPNQVPSEPFDDDEPIVSDFWDGWRSGRTSGHYPLMAVGRTPELAVTRIRKLKS